jgi:hypothetical protein
VTGHLIECRFKGSPVTVGHATRDEVMGLVRPLDPDTARDRLDLWLLIAIREPNGRGTMVHGLGWRAEAGTTWITSAIVAISFDPAMISTQSGNAYLLGPGGTLEEDSELWNHLLYALKTWGFSDQILM